MKKFILLFIVLCINILFSACGKTSPESESYEKENLESESYETNDSEKDFQEKIDLETEISVEIRENCSEFDYLTEMDWIDVVDKEIHLTLGRNGKGTYNSFDSTWDVKDNVLTVSYIVENEQSKSLTYDIREIDGILTLYGTEDNIADASAFVRLEVYETGSNLIKEYFSTQSFDLEWKVVYQEYLENEDAAKAEYDGEYVWWTATVYEIQEDHCQMISGDDTSNSITVYINGEDLEKLEVGQLISVVGIFELDSTTCIKNAHVSEF